MRNYQRQRNNPYKLPNSLYRRSLATLQDYPRLLALQEELYESAFSGGDTLTDNTLEKAKRFVAVSQDIDTIQRALHAIPPEYQEGLLRNMIEGVPREALMADPSTWSRWRGRLLYFVAMESGWL